MVRKKIPLVIHAGRHKTGTTFLQQFLGINRQLLLKKYEILYPISGFNNYFHYHHSLLSELGKDVPEFEKMLSTLEEEVRLSRPRSILLSSEYLSRSSVNGKFLENLKDSLRDYEVKIIFYLRDPVDFLCSRYSEQVKRGILCYPHSIWSINAELDYARFLERYVNVFGESNVQVRSYDKARKKMGLLSDFTEWLGLNDISEFRLPTANKNKRLPWNYLYLPHYCNKNRYFRSLATSDIVRKIFIKGSLFLPAIFDGQRPISEAQSKMLSAEFKLSNEQVIRHFKGTPNLFGLSE